MKVKATLLATATLMALGASGTASAIEIIQNVGGCLVTDVTNGGVSANSCEGLFTGSGGGQNVDLDDILGLYGSGFSLLGKSTESGPVSTLGNTWSASGLDGYSEFVVALKQATYWGSYYFTPANGWSGTWSTSGWAIGQPAGGLSHLDVYVRGPVRVPEPGTLALLGMGLLGLAASARRKKRT